MRTLEPLDIAAALLPGDMGDGLSGLAPSERRRAEELRLRAGRPLSVLLPGGEKEVGGVVTARGLDRLLETATAASAHTALASVTKGYVTVRGGLRLGLCGEAAIRDGSVTALRRLSSVCIRLPREAKGCADGILPALLSGGFRDALLISPPGAGKTTLLRELVRRLSDGGTRVSLIDERGEAAAVWEGEPMFDVGGRTDVMTGVPKALAAVSLLRSMSPELMAMDEITAPEDVEAVALAAGCGVRLLAACHGESPEELCRRPLYRQMLALGVFRRCVVIATAPDGARKYEVREMSPC